MERILRWSGYKKKKIKRKKQTVMERNAQNVKDSCRVENKVAERRRKMRRNEKKEEKREERWKGDKGEERSRKEQKGKKGAKKGEEG